MSTKSVSKFWKYLGAMMTEMKNGSMAASFTRVLGVVTFLIWAVIAVCESFGVATLPSYVTYVLLGLIGIKGAKDTAQALKGTDSFTKKGDGDAVQR